MWFWCLKKNVACTKKPHQKYEFENKKNHTIYSFLFGSDLKQNEAYSASVESTQQWEAVARKQLTSHVEQAHNNRDPSRLR